MLPNYLIVGAPRCGTSWLSKNLELHPDVFMPSVKEIHFFDLNYDKGIAWYENIFEGRTEKAIGEATPGYLYPPEAPNLIKKHMPNVKLIVSLRNPVDRAYSHYWFRERERRKHKQSVTFEEKISLTPRLIEESMYADSLERYFNSFSKSNVLVMLYDEIEANPEQYLKKVLSFLEVNVSYLPPLVNNRINSSTRKISKFYLLSKGLLKLGFYNLERVLNQVDRKSVPAINQNTKKMLLENFIWPIFISWKICLIWICLIGGNRVYCLRASHPDGCQPSAHAV